MDPVNAAGLGLGAASLAFQIFDGVLKGLREIGAENDTC